MPSIPIYPPPTDTTAPASPLPQFLQTPSGLALVEIQGTLNVPDPSEGDADAADADGTSPPSTVQIGRLVFPTPAEREAGDKRVWMFVGQHQRMLGTVKELKVPLGVLRRRRQRKEGGEEEELGAGGGGDPEELEIVELIKWKVVFANRPEPV